MDDDRDPFTPPTIPPGGARALAVAAFVSGPLSLALFPLGVLGMVFGTLAHAKGDRLGLPSAFVAGIGTILGMAVIFFLRR